MHFLNLKILKLLQETNDGVVFFSNSEEKKSGVAVSVHTAIGSNVKRLRVCL